MIELKTPTEPKQETLTFADSNKYARDHYTAKKEDRWKYFKEGILMGKALGELDVLEESDLRNLFEDFSIRNP